MYSGEVCVSRVLGIRAKKAAFVSDTAAPLGMSGNDRGKRQLDLFFANVFLISDWPVFL